jgi:hypothetical protein
MLRDTFAELLVEVPGVLVEPPANGERDRRAVRVSPDPYERPDGLAIVRIGIEAKLDALLKGLVLRVAGREVQTPHPRDVDVVNPVSPEDG